jgi:putative hemolysin
VKLMANFLLKKIRFAEDHMIFVDPFAASKPAAHNIAPLRESLKHLKAGGLLAVFPGNKVSHYQWHRGEIADPEWVPHIGALIRRTGASVVPVFIEGGNSRLFNIAGMIHPLLRTILLPREFLRKGRSGVPVRVHVGTAIPSTRLKRFASDEEMIRFLRVTTYFLGNRPKASAASLSTALADKTKRAEPIADPMPSDLLEADVKALPREACLLKQGDSEVYMARYDQLPHVMREIGRGREISFRAAGGGTMKPRDLAPQDEYYEHLFIWNKKDRVVVGAYRIGRADEIIAKHGTEGLICTGLFHFKPAFVEKLNPGIELGRSYVLPEYQRSYSSLALLWGGIIAFAAREPRYNIFFGSVGVSQGGEYADASRTLIIDLLRSQFSDAKLSVEVRSQSPFEGVRLNGITPEEIGDLVQDVEDVSTLVTSLEPDGKGVPVLLKHYFRMNAKLLDFGVWKNHSNAVVAFIICDMATAEPRMIRRYMGEEGYARFRAYHGLDSGEA